MHHAHISEDDLDWLAPVEQLTLWNVTVSPRFFSRLPNLWWLDLSGGSASDLGIIQGCTSLRYFGANQIRGLHDLSSLLELQNLAYLDLYGLRNVTSLPSFSGLSRLLHIRMGQMKGLPSLGSVLDAPHLEELELLKTVHISEQDIQTINNHATMKAFVWFAEDVPDKTWFPVCQRIRLPRLEVLSPNEWFAARK